MSTRCGYRTAFAAWLLLLPYLASAASTPTPTATSTPVVRGCCQVSQSRPGSGPICGNAIPQGDCLNDFAGDSVFCRDCVCTSHGEPGFDFGSPGVCAARTSTPTRTPTPSPTPTSTNTPISTPTPVSGCCQVNSSRPGPRPFICGNQISRDSCLQNYGADATYCADCYCSSHSGPGFTFAPGTCVSRSTARPVRTRPPKPTRPPRPTRVPRLPR